jgi:hypothetical protein
MRLPTAGGLPGLAAAHTANRPICKAPCFRSSSVIGNGTFLLTDLKSRKRPYGRSLHVNIRRSGLTQSLCLLPKLCFLSIQIHEIFLSTDFDNAPHTVSTGFPTGSTREQPQYCPPGAAARGSGRRLNHALPPPDRFQGTGSETKRLPATAIPLP